MDFACAPCIVEAVQKRAAHPVYGYGCLLYTSADLGGPVTSNEQGVSVYISAIPFNFYAILMVLITLLSALEILSLIHI